MEHSWTFYRVHFKKLLIVPITLTLLSEIPSYAGNIQALSKNALTLSLPQSFTLFGIGIVGIAITVFLTLTFVRQIHDLKTGAGTLKSAFILVLKRFPRIIIAGVISGALLVLIGLPYLLPAAYFYAIKHNTVLSLEFLGFGLPLLIPMLWLSIKLMGAPLLIVLDDVGAIDSIKKSFDLVKGKWWKACVRRLVPQLGWALIQFLLSFIFEIIVFVVLVLIAHQTLAPQQQSTLALTAILTAIMDVLFMPLSIASLVIWFEEMKK